MAKMSTEFFYSNIELYKSEILGSGSYGGVCKATCDGLLCAAKIMHPTLFDLRDPGTTSYLRKFQEECHLLSLVRHPNIVQYLATYSDPDTRLPVLLMELCDESLTAFLEHSPGPLSYHIQLNICHDIALALVYLHSNGLIHRDLTGNNVLMIAGTRAKITDFGMSKLATINPHMTALTLCPGNVLYMSPEALDDTKSYTTMLDIFSFGVIIVQILTRLFPCPTDRFRKVHDSRYNTELRLVIPDTERRQAHLQLISDTHSIKPLAVQCLMKENKRPSALQLSGRLSALKQTPQYTESMHHSQSVSNIQQLQQQVRSLRILSEAKASEHQARIAELHMTVEENQHTIDVKDRQLQKYQTVLETKERELQQTQELLMTKDKVIRDLQQTISEQERKILQHNEASNTQLQQQPVTKGTLQTTVEVAKKDISKMTWRDVKNAPEKMKRGAAVVHGNIAYFRPANSRKVYAYENIAGEEQWSRLPDNPNQSFSLAVIDGLLTSVGGYKDGYSNTLFSLTGRKCWSEIFPPMLTPRSDASSVTNEQALVVAGGNAGGVIDTVELMTISTKQWTTVCSLPGKYLGVSAITCGDSLYLAGGITDGYSPSQSIFTCSLSNLKQPERRRSILRRTYSSSSGKSSYSSKSNIWKEIRSLPEISSTLASVGGHLLALGGCDDSWNPTTHVYRYDSLTDSWRVVSQMKNKRSSCFAVTLPEDRLIVVGGVKSLGDESDSVEICEK